MLEKDDDSSSGKSFQTETENPNNISSDSIDSIRNYFTMNKLLDEKHFNKQEMKKEISGLFKVPVCKKINTNEKIPNKDYLFFLRRQENQNHQNKIVKREHKYSDLEFYALLQVLEGYAPKILSKYSMTSVGKDLFALVYDDKNEDIFINLLFVICNLGHILQFFVDNREPYYPLAIEDIKKTILKNILVNKNNINVYNKLYNDLQKIYKMLFSKKKDPNKTHDYFKYMLSNIFQLFNIINNDYIYNKQLDNDKKIKKERQKILEFITRTFFLILFTNKLDIKGDNVLIDKQNRITHIDLLNEGNRGKGFFNTSWNFENIAADDPNLMSNKLILLPSILTVFHKDNPYFKTILERYTLDEKKIKKIVMQIIENYSRSDKNKEDYSEKIRLFLLQFTLYTKTIMQDFDELKNQMLKYTPKELKSEEFLKHFNDCMKQINNVLKQNFNVLYSLLLKDHEYLDNIIRETLEREEEVKKNEEEVKKNKEEEKKEQDELILRKKDINNIEIEGGTKTKNNCPCPCDCSYF